MDALRGTAIILVILYHATLNVQDTYDAAPTWLVLVNAPLTAVRMPAMMFLSGLLLSDSLRKGARRYTAGKLRAIAWPFLIWTLIAYAYETTDYLLGEGPLDLPNPIEAVVNPIGHLWFLQIIFLCYMIALALQKMSPLIPAAIAIAAGILLEGDALRFATLFACFMIGAWFSTRMATFQRITHQRWVLAISAAVSIALCLVVAAGVDMESFVRYEVISLPFVAAAVLLASRAAMAVAHQRWVAPLRYIGRNSLIFYLVHGYPLVIAATVTMRLTGNGLAAITIGLAVGLVSSLAASMLQHRYRPFRIFFEFPSRERRSVRTRS